MLPPAAANSYTMDPARVEAKPAGSSDDECLTPLSEVKNAGEATGEKRSEPASSVSGEPTTSANGRKRQKRASSAPAVDLSVIAKATPGGSSHRGAMKELLAERKKLQKEHKAATKKIRLEAQRQKRLIEKASKLNNEDLMEIFKQRHENQEAFKAAAKSAAKKGTKS